MTKSKIIMLMAAVALIAGAGAAAVSVNASEADKVESKFNFKPMHQQMTDEERVQMKEKMDAQRAAVEEAINNGDYQAWAAAIGDKNPFADKITEDNFATFVEAHKLMAQAQAKFAELGIENKGGFGGQGMGRGHGGFGWGAQVEKAK